MLEWEIQMIQQKLADMKCRIEASRLLVYQAALAKMKAGKLTLWVHSQGVYPIRSAVARVLDLSIDQVRVIHMESSGCYGHNGADDAALDAALLARALPGQPVSVKWTREDEHTWEPYALSLQRFFQ